MQSRKAVDDRSLVINFPFDPEVDIEVTRHSSFRIMACIEKELEAVSNKDAESMVLYVTNILDGIDESFYCVRRKSGFTSEKDRHAGNV